MNLAPVLWPPGTDFELLTDLARPFVDTFSRAIESGLSLSLIELLFKTLHVTPKAMQILISGNAWITIPILIMGIVSVFLLIYAVVRFIRRKTIRSLVCDTILFLGLGSLAWAIIGQLTGLFVAADYIQKNPEVQASIIWAGFKLSLIGPIMGIGMFIFSGIGWFVVRFLREPLRKNN